MKTPTDYKYVHGNDTNKAFSNKKYLHFYDNNYAFITIDKLIVEKLQLTESDAFVEEIIPEGILLRKMK